MPQSRENWSRPTQDFTDEEIARRRDEALLRALSTPHKPHSAMKLGRTKGKPNKSPTKRTQKIPAKSPET